MYNFITQPHPHGHWQLQGLLAIYMYLYIYNYTVLQRKDRIKTGPVDNQNNLTKYEWRFSSSQKRV